MAFVEYLLLAVLGSTGAAASGGTPSSPSTRTFDADAIAQPSGGAAVEERFVATTGMSAQATGGSTGKQTGGKKPVRNKLARRHHRTTNKHSGATGNAKSPTGKDKK